MSYRWFTKYEDHDQKISFVYRAQQLFQKSICPWKRLISAYYCEKNVVLFEAYLISSMKWKLRGKKRNSCNSDRFLTEKKQVNLRTNLLIKTAPRMSSVIASWICLLPSWVSLSITNPFPAQIITNLGIKLKMFPSPPADFIVKWMFKTGRWIGPRAISRELDC